MGHQFGVGHGTGSQTIDTRWVVGHYLGNPTNPLITIIDTPGVGDTEGRDRDQALELVEVLKRVGSIDAFIVHLQGMYSRFSRPLQEQLNTYQGIFGKKMWNNTILEFTFWSHDRWSIDKRMWNQETNTTIKHNDMNKAFAERFQLEMTLPSVFVDPAFKERRADEDEKRLNEENTDKLWRLLTDNLTLPFECGNGCQAGQLSF